MKAVVLTLLFVETVDQIELKIPNSTCRESTHVSQFHSEVSADDHCNFGKNCHSFEGSEWVASEIDLTLLGLGRLRINCN